MQIREGFEILFSTGSGSLDVPVVLIEMIVEFAVHKNYRAMKLSQ